MVRREHVTDDRGRRWITGALPSEDYFREARKRAREDARRTVLSRLVRRPNRRRVPAGR